jgi:CHASE2 domain-containing sensor protein
MAKGYFDKSSPTLLLVFLALALSYTDLLWRFDRWIYDAELQLLTRPASPDIVIIEVDQKSLNQIGRWPWPRNVHARLLQLLAQAKTQAIGFDMLFAEDDPQHPELDNQFADALAAARTVVLPMIIEHNGPKLVETPPLPAYSQYAVLGHANVDLDKDGVSRSVLLQLGV